MIVWNVQVYRVNPETARPDFYKVLSECEFVIEVRHMDMRHFTIVSTITITQRLLQALPLSLDRSTLKLEKTYERTN